VGPRAPWKKRGREERGKMGRKGGTTKERKRKGGTGNRRKMRGGKEHCLALV